MGKYSRAVSDNSQVAKARGSDLRVHFKNTWQVARRVRGMRLRKAQRYLTDVLAHKRCVPYIKFRHACGNTPQAKEWKESNGQGRWPRKSVELVQSLLKNAESNADTKGLDADKLAISHIQVNRAQKLRRRCYRAHGRVGAFMSSPCHVELILEETKAPAPPPTSQAIRQGRVKPPAHKRFGDRQHRCTYK
eukprot:TRINITY_DN447_c0_g1_i1.p2 TRINITY_DN447_c0_g1~~TRINITY_DN447_c0_g1_i1.p2  ORF type:complete len:191 (+),score=73.20 TRINITY_DN447_c0_g1_i1:96-668(+)